MVLAAVALGSALAAPAAARAGANEPPAGLSRDDWSGIRRSIRQSRHHASRPLPATLDPSLVHEAQLFGHGDPVGQAGAELGFSVSVSGDTAVVGAPYDDTPGGVDAGAAHVFVRSGTTWTEQQRLLAPDGAAGDLFGSSVSIDGDTVVVGAYAGDTPGGVNAGAAYVFVRSGTTWTEQQKLLASDGAAGASFGYSVAVSGDTAVAGAVTDDTPGGALAGSAYVFVRSGTTWSEQEKLLASDAAASDLFGVSVSIDGETVVVGAYADDIPGGTNAGSAYVFVRSGTTWTQQQKLLASDGAPFDFFGVSVSVSVDTAVVGAYRNTNVGGVGAGAAYVFVRSGTTWTEQQKLLASDPAVNHFFGYSVSVSADTAVVGAYLDDNAGGVDAGSVYVFVRSGPNWSEQQKLLASDAAASDWFGFSVSVSGDTVVAGAQLADTPGGVDAGAAYAFARSGTSWTEQQKLLASDTATTADEFGLSVSVSGDTAVVGAPHDDTPGGGDAGSAYVFVRSGTTWTEQQKLRASDAAAGDSFGHSVAIDGDTVVVGAYAGDTPGGVNAGAAYVFVRSGTTWAEQQKLLASDAAAGDSFGYSVAVSGDTAVVGAVTDKTPGGALAGSAYVFVRSGTTWTEQQHLLASDAAASDLFGVSVSVSGDTAVVGAYAGDTPGGGNAGAAYVFVRSVTTWSEQQKLLASDAAEGDLFGVSVSISGDTVLAGAYLADTAGGVDAGAAYVFVRSGATWTEQQKLVASDPAAGDLFGSSVSVSGDILVVGAYWEDTAAGVDAGSAYVFVRSGTTWSEQRRLLAPDGAANDGFGYSVSVSGDTVIVGAPLDDTPDGVDGGSAHVLRVLQSDLSAAKTDGQTAAVPGQPVSYTITVANAGPGGVTGATVTDSVPAILLEAAWTCAASPGSACSPGGSGSINDTVNLLVGGTATYTLTGTVDSTATGTLANTASVAAPPGTIDPPANNSATDTDTLTPEADLSATKTDGQATAVPGQPVTYTITVANAGPSAVTGATVSDSVPAILLGAAWTCSASPGSSCSPGGSGSINDTVNLLVAGTATYTLTATVDPAATGTLVNTATVAAPPGTIDPTPANNTARDTDTLTPQADLLAAKTDGQEATVPGQPVTYTITIANAGPSAVTGATVTDTVPATLLGAVWTCSASPGSSCSPGGSGSINDTVDLLLAGTATYLLTGTVDSAATGTLVNTASVAAPPGTIDPTPANNSDTDTDIILTAGDAIEGELIHGSEGWHDLAALPGPAPDQDLFRIFQRGHASYEVLLDGASGDIGSGSGPLLERVASDASTVLQGSSPVGAGGSRSLCWMNALATPVSDELVRVRSAGCTTDCDAADVYRLSAFETTGFIPRFNNSATQVTVLVIRNLGAQAIDMDVRFWSAPGASLGGPPVLTLGPGQSYVLNTSTIVPGSGGSITVAHTGRYGQLTGKAVAVEPATGFTFDTGMVSRPR